MRWHRRVIPTDEQYRNPAIGATGSLADPNALPPIGFHSVGDRADYYLAHDRAPGRDPRRTTWSPLIGAHNSGLTLARAGVDLSTAVHYAADIDTHERTTV
jgi:hypothetical protein